MLGGHQRAHVFTLNQKSSWLEAYENATVWLYYLICAMGEAIYRETDSESLWIACTADKYELPIAVADSAKELARYLGIAENSAYYMYNKNSDSRYKRFGENFCVKKVESSNPFKRKVNNENQT